MSDNAIGIEIIKELTNIKENDNVTSDQVLV